MVGYSLIVAFNDRSRGGLVKALEGVRCGSYQLSAKYLSKQTCKLLLHFLHCLQKQRRLECLSLDELLQIFTVIRGERRYFTDHLVLHMAAGVGQERRLWWW